MGRTVRWLKAIPLGVAFALAPLDAVSCQDAPYLAGYVLDEAGLMSQEAETRLNARLEAFAGETGSQVVVLTVPDLGGMGIEQFSIGRAEEWQLGRGEYDDGVLFVIARDERRMRIEVGYGLEGVLTDAASRRILDNTAQPRFRAGDFDGGIEAATERILSTIRGEVPSPVVGPQAPSAGPGPGAVPVFFQLLVLLLFMFILVRILSRRSRARRWSSRNGWRPPYGPVVVLPPDRGPPRGTTIRFPGGVGLRSGGGFRGGGGSFGGGGASGSW